MRSSGVAFVFSLCAWASPQSAVAGSEQVVFDLTDPQWNPGNALEGILPASQWPVKTPDALRWTDLRRGPGLTERFMRRGFAGGNWVAPAGGAFDRAAAFAGSHYFEWTLSVRPGWEVRFETFVYALRHVTNQDARLSELEWQFSWDGFRSEGEMLACIMMEGTAGTDQPQELPPLDLRAITAKVPLRAHRTLTLRLYAWDRADLVGSPNGFSALGFAPSPEGAGGAPGPVLTLTVSPEETWQARYLDWLSAQDVEAPSGETFADLAALPLVSEFVFGREATPPPRASLHAAEDGVPTLTFEAHLNPRADGMPLIVESTTDLQTWSLYPATVVGENPERVRVAVSY